VLTKVGLDTFVDPDREGGAMNAAAAETPMVKHMSSKVRTGSISGDCPGCGDHPRHHGG
jgi:hypothetical protein